MPTGYYIMACRGSDHAYRLPLVGPFRSMRAAMRMWDVVHDATRRVRPDLADCDIRPMSYNSGKGALPKGRLDLTQAVDADWIEGCIYGPQR